MDEIKRNNLLAYTENQEDFMKRYNNFPPRIEDINIAFNLYNWKKSKSSIEVLELWCCFWREYSYIQTITKNYIGVDIQDKAIQYAQEKYWKEKFICWNFEEIVLLKNQDIIFAFASLLHCDREAIRSMLLKIYDTLNTNGIAYISLKYAQNYTVYTEKESWRVFYLYNIKEFKNMSWDLFTVIYEDTHTYNNQEWFTIALLKNK